MVDKIFLNIPTRLVYCGYKKQNKKNNMQPIYLPCRGRVMYVCQ